MPYLASEYQDYNRLTQILHEWAERYPQLISLNSLGPSQQGREIWQLTLTNKATGPDLEKPGYLIDGCHHAMEVTSTALNLHVVNWLLTQYGNDPTATELLDTRALYVVPRITVDATEEFFTGGNHVRSRVALYPESEERPGLVPQDVDGDGMILQMRLEDAAGSWKVSARDERLLIKRQPQDRSEGPFYRVFNEGLMRTSGPDGMIDGHDGRGVTVAPNRWGLDFNRNYPINWAMHHRQPGAGAYPFSEPEIHALGKFVLDHPNIGGWMSYHTTGGVNLRPAAVKKDDKMNQVDLERYKAIGDLGTRITGYPHKNLFEVYTVNPERPAIGSSLEFGYDYLGILMFGPELWDVKGQAGLPSWGSKSMKQIHDMSDADQEEEGLKLLAWDDQENGSAGFIPWRSFQHPQLGQVEIGGWDRKTCLSNPPPGRFLEQELDKNLRFPIEHALASPLIRVGKVQIKALGADLFEMGVQVVNQGFLPTNVTEVAVQQKRVTGVDLTVEGAEVIAVRDAELRNGRYNLGEIPGWGNESERWVQFVVRAAAGSSVTLTATHVRAGRSVQEVALRQ